VAFVLWNRLSRRPPQVDSPHLHETQFVHYKWRSVDPDEDRRAEEVELLQLAESVVGELDELENQLMYGGLRARAHSGFSDPANESPGNPWSPRGTLDLNKQRNSGAR
jgi:hypothetical protein